MTFQTAAAILTGQIVCNASLYVMHDLQDIRRNGARLRTLHMGIW